MRLRYLALATGLALTLAGTTPVCAGGDKPYADFEARLNELVAPQAWLKGRMTEADVNLLFDYVRASLFAATQGLPAPAAPERLKQRVEELQRELETQGALTGLLLLNALEAAVRQSVRESLADPGTER
jgi:hypothetical protein